MVKKLYHQKRHTSHNYHQVITDNKKLIGELLIAIGILVVLSRLASATGSSGGSGAKLLFEDDFNGISLDTSKWVPGMFGTGITGIIDNVCDDSNLVSVNVNGDGFLHLKLIQQTNTCPGGQYFPGGTTQYTGSLVSSNPHDGIAGHIGFEYTRGYIEFKAYLPAASPGIIANFPALWSDGQSDQTYGEIDNMEGVNGQACFNYHSHSSTGVSNCPSGGYTGWHTFGSDWQNGIVTYYYDRKMIGQITQGVNSYPEYIIMDIGIYQPTVVPSEILIDYVRVWDKKPFIDAMT